MQPAAYIDNTRHPSQAPWSGSPQLPCNLRSRESMTAGSERRAEFGEPALGIREWRLYNFSLSCAAVIKVSCTIEDTG